MENEKKYTLSYLKKMEKKITIQLAKNALQTELHNINLQNVQNQLQNQQNQQNQQN